MNLFARFLMIGLLMILPVLGSCCKETGGTLPGVSSKLDYAAAIKPTKYILLELEVSPAEGFIESAEYEGDGVAPLRLKELKAHLAAFAEHAKELNRQPFLVLTSRSDTRWRFVFDALFEAKTAGFMISLLLGAAEERASRGIPVRPLWAPSQKQEDSAPPAGPVVSITISDQESKNTDTYYTVTLPSKHQQSLSMNDLTGLSKLLSNVHPTPGKGPVVLEAASSVKYSNVKILLDQLLAAGYQRVELRLNNSSIVLSLPGVVEAKHEDVIRPLNMQWKNEQLALVGAVSGPIVRFAGTGTGAHHVVYIIDNSGSMAARFGSSTLMDIAKSNVFSSLAKLREAHDFNLIVFGNKTEEWPTKGLVPANVPNKAAAARFLDSIITSKECADPVPALNRAFDILTNPPNDLPGKAIFLITAGGFPDNKALLRCIRERNKNKDVYINTYYMKSDERPHDKESLEMLKVIATETSGLLKIIEDEQ